MGDVRDFVGSTLPEELIVAINNEIDVPDSELSVDTRLSTLESDTASNTSRITTAEAAIDAAESSITIAEASITSVTSRVATVEGQVGDYTFLAGSVDPSAGAGVAATAPALYVRTDAGGNQVFLKTGVANTAWTQLNLRAVTTFLDTSATFVATVNAQSTDTGGLLNVSGGTTVTVNHPLITAQSVVSTQFDSVSPTRNLSVRALPGQFIVYISATAVAPNFIRWGIVKV